MKKIFDLINCYIVYLIIIYLNVATTLKILFKIDNFWFSVGIIILGLISLVFYLLYKILYIRKINYKDLIIVLLTICGFISYNYAYNKVVALFGIVNRYEGLWVIISYYSFFLLSTIINKEKYHSIMRLIIVFGIYQIILGTIQTLRINNIFGYYRGNNYSANYKFASGTLSNPNFYSTYILACLCYVYGLLLNNKKIKYWLLTILFGYGLVIGNTMSCILAFLFILVFTLTKRINRVNIKKIFLIFVIFGALIFVFNKVINNRLSYNINKSINGVYMIIKNKEYDKLGNSRIYVWKETLKHTNKYFLHGIGIDNFSFINRGNYICTTVDKKYECFDKAHNEYLQKFITEGIFSLVLYLFLIITTIIKTFRQKDRDEYIYAIFLCYIAYLIQAFFNISVIQVAPIFYIILGLLNSGIFNSKFVKD
ncbi:MAG: O-antigen ligase family protein [Bacilli bacterium]|nr:O-antigen ligase family protein [Bacilli bacterium]